MLVPIDRVDAAQNVITKHELVATIEHEPVLAMAEICLQVELFRKDLAWCDKPQSPQLILLHTQDLHGVNELINAIKKYYPSVIVSELRDGRIQHIDNHGAVVDSINELPIVHSEEVDANELSMLLENKPSEVEE